MEITWYPAIKALHLIFMVTFFAGTFYMVRLFIYHKEALGRFEPDRTILTRQFIAMERKLWFIITWPSFILMTVLGFTLLVSNPALLKQPWMHAKLGLIALLFVYHLKNHAIWLRARDNDIRWSSFGLRLWNEGATLVLFGAVFLAVLKRLDPWIGAIGLVVLGLVLLMATLGYRKRREAARRSAEEADATAQRKV